MYIAIRKDSNGKIYIDKFLFRHHDVNDLTGSLYSKVEVPDECVKALSAEDFDGMLRFDKARFDARLAREADLKRLSELQCRLKELSEDIIQIQCGAVFEDAEIRKAEFRNTHNEIRRIIGKAPRVYNTSTESLDTNTNIVI